MEIRKQTSKYSKVHVNLDTIKKQLQQAIKQLKIFKRNLFQTTKTVQVIQKANKIDYNFMIDHFAKKSKKISKQIKINLKIQQNKQKRQQFRVILKNLIQVKSNDENKPKPRRQQFKDSLAFQAQQMRNSYSRQLKKQFITNVPPLSADRYFTKSSFLIQKQNYFKSGQPFLHFFQVSKTNLHIVKIKQLQQNLPLKWQIIPLSTPTNFTIPSFHKTIATQDGIIYLIGGTQQSSMKKSPFIYQYIPTTHTLHPISTLTYPRSSHSLTCHKGLIYIIGGIGDNDALVQCQIFNSYLSTCQSITSCKYPTINSCVSYMISTNSLIKLGGIFPTGENNDHVEIYNITNNLWIQIDPIIENIKGQFQLLSCSGWSYLNNNQIFIYGGYNEQKDNQSSNLSYIIECNIFYHLIKLLLFIDNQHQNQYSIKHINIKNLPTQEGFWSQQAVVYNNVVYGLQNVDGEEGGDCVEDQRNVVVFDGKYWKMF